VGVKQGFQGPSGQLQLYLGNKSDATLGRLICAVPPQPAFALQLGFVPPAIEPKKQVGGLDYTGRVASRASEGLHDEWYCCMVTAAAELPGHPLDLWTGGHGMIAGSFWQRWRLSAALLYMSKAKTNPGGV